MKCVPLMCLLFFVPVGCGAAIDEAISGESAFSSRASHPYFPLEPGREWYYLGTKDDVVHEEYLSVGHDLRSIGGVDCAALVGEIRIAGVLEQVTTEWFAADRNGNIWKFGEETLERDAHGLMVLGDDGWLAGEGDAEPWVYLPIRPLVGDVHSGRSARGTERIEILSVGAKESVPAGDFSDCLAIAEEEDDPDDQDIILFSAGVGRLSETNPSGRIQLVTTKPR